MASTEDSASGKVPPANPSDSSNSDIVNSNRSGANSVVDSTPKAMPPVSTSPPPLEATAALTKLQNSPVFPPRLSASSAAAAAAAVLGPLSPLTQVTTVPHQMLSNAGMISLSTPVFVVANQSPQLSSIDVNASPRSTILDPRLTSGNIIGSPTAFAPIQPNITGSPLLSSTTGHTFVPQASLQPGRQVLGSPGFPPIHSFTEDAVLRSRKLPASTLSNTLYFTGSNSVTSSPVGSPSMSSPLLSQLMDAQPQAQQILSPLTTEVTSPLVTTVEQERKALATPVKNPKAGKTATPGSKRKSAKTARMNVQQGTPVSGLMPMGPGASPATTPDSVPREKKRRGRPPTEKPHACSHCGTTTTPEWRRGKVAEGVYVPLCNACGLQLAKRNRLQRQSAANQQQAAQQAAVQQQAGQAQGGAQQRSPQGRQRRSPTTEQPPDPIDPALLAQTVPTGPDMKAPLSSLIMPGSSVNVPGMK